MPFELHEYYQNCLESKISIFSDRFRTQVQSSSQLSLKKFKERGLSLRTPLQDRASISGS